MAHEHTAFLSDCAKDNASARRTAASAVRAAYADPRNLSDKEWEDIIVMVKALTGIAQRSGRSASSNGTDVPSPRATHGGPRPLPTPPASTPRTQWGAPPVRPPGSHSTKAFDPRSATLVDSPTTEFHRPDHQKPAGRVTSANEGPRGSQDSSRSSRRGRQEGVCTEKERKRRALEKAELHLSRKGSAQSRASETSQVTARRV